MDKKKIDNSAFSFPMPVVLVGANVGGKPNFMAVAWITKVTYKPLVIGVSINKRQLTGEGIIANETFSINLPGADIVKQTDYCGLVSGRNEDKSGIFDVFYGELKTAPMIGECPLCAECRLVDTHITGTNHFFLGEVMNVYSEDKYLEKDEPDNSKVKPFVLMMPDKQYVLPGESIGEAWEVGRN